MMEKLKIGALVASTLVPLWSLSSAYAKSDEYAPYQKTSGISGSLSSIGSDTLANVMALWGEGFKSFYPSVNIQIQAAGSSTAPPALANGSSQFGPMSRAMKADEIAAFEKQFGYKPTAIRVAVDALAIFVHKDNPIKGMTIQEVDGIFSSTLKCGGKNITQWGQLGLPGSWGKRDLQLFGRNSVSGTYGYFKKKALCKGDFKNKVNEQPGSASVVQSVTASLSAVGYSGMGYQTSGVRAIPIGKTKNNLVEPTTANAASNKYPLARFLYVYINKAPNKPLQPMEAEFIKMIFSKEGQAIVEKDGYVSVPKEVADKDLEMLGLKELKS